MMSGSSPVPAGQPVGWAPGQLRADPYGPSPLVTDLSIRNLNLFNLASERGPAPTLFASGDLPPFTASGVDPQVLTRLPYSMRHAAASEPEASKVLAMVEECAADPERMGRGAAPHRGLEDYRMRMDAWLAGIQIPDVPFGEATYPESWKPAHLKRAEAAAREQQAREAEADRLREEIGKAASSRQDFSALLDQLAALESKSTP